MFHLLYCPRTVLNLSAASCAALILSSPVCCPQFNCGETILVIRQSVQPHQTKFLVLDPTEAPMGWFYVVVFSFYLSVPHKQMSWRPSLAPACLSSHKCSSCTYFLVTFIWLNLFGQRMNYSLTSGLVGNNTVDVLHRADTVCTRVSPQKHYVDILLRTLQYT